MRLAGPLLALLLLLCLPILAQAAAPADELRAADQFVVQAAATLQAGDVATARQAYQDYLTRWRTFEDEVRDADQNQYLAIENAQRDVRAALLGEPADPSRAAAALDALHERDAAFWSSPAAAGASGASSPASGSLAEVISHLDTARAALAKHDAATASNELQAFQHDWPGVEGGVKAKSPSAYTATEDDMQVAEADLSAADPGSQAQADALLSRMHERLAPLAEGGASYGVFDAFVIMLREGLEALLVVGALTAFVKRSAGSDGRGLRFIWGGSAAGVLLSVVAAVVLQQVFSRAGAGLGTELVEGFVGLTAAAMLFYVSYWLHAKSRLGAWQRYIRERSSAALASGSMLSLGLVAFLAVFREGAETAVFYLGIAPSIAPSDLLLGLGAGLLALVAIGAAVLLIGLRLPLRPFFLASSALIYYLGFKFLGTGLHALQVAGVLPATPAPVPTSDVLGVYSTWETLVPQLVLLLIAAAVVWLSLRGRRQPSSRPLAAA